MARARTHYKAGRTAKTPTADGGAVVLRGFVRGALVDPDGTTHLGDWHENIITTKGVEHVMLLFATTGGAQGNWIAVGNNTATLSSTQTAMQTEYAPSTSGGTARIQPTVSTSSYGTLSYTASYASSQITSTATINGVAIHAVSSTGSGSAYSIATFNSSTKGSTQALNVTYTWNFATA